MVLVMTKYQEILMLVNSIESKYGSIVNCPEDDPDYLRIREIYYVRSLGQFVKSYFKYPPSQSNKSKWLKARGYSISKGDYRWKFIRNGSYYLPPYLDKPVIKQGINSYIYEEDC